MDAIFALPPNLPPHDKAPLRTVPHCVIAEWPEGTFLENLAVLDDGDIAVAVMTEARIDRVSLSGLRSTLIQLSEPPTGLSVIDGMLYAAVGEPGGGAAHLWRIDPRSGGAESWMPLEGVVFANGLTPFASGRLMLAESHLGQLCLIDLAAKRTSVWIEDEKLSRTEGIPFLPGANGVKRYGDTVTVSSNGRALLLRAAVRPDGSADTLEVIAERLRVDDLAFDMHGAAYLCTHIGHSLDWLSPSGERVSLGAAAQGLAGSTACAFGRHGAERRALYVTTTGGIVTPPGGVVQAAKLVRLEVGAVGYPLSGLA